MRGLVYEVVCEQYVYVEDELVCSHHHNNLKNMLNRFVVTDALG